VESGAFRPDLTDFAVAALFRELRGDFANLATNKGLKLHVEDCSDCVHSDPSLVQQILSNLEALLATRPAGPVECEGAAPP
jgi:signal transduction histidine kinase